MLLFLLSSASAVTLTVEADGSGDYASISAALSAAGQGDVIQVGAGTWREALSVGEKRVTITGSAGAESVILDATDAPSAVTAQGELNLSEMTIRNDGGRGLTASGSANITLSNITFDNIGDVDEAGSAVQITGGSVTLQESLIDGGSAAYGMIFIANGSSLTLTDSSIKGASATYGAGIYISNGSAALSGSILEQLYSTSSGGAVYLQAGTSLTAADTTFYANLTESGDGAAIYASGASIETTDSTFALNYSINYIDGYSGGAVFLSASQMTATRTIFTENIAYYGGAVRVTGSSALDLIDSELSDNFAYYGGAVYGADVFTIQDSGSEWAGNEAYYSGAAIYAYAQYTIDIEGSQFIENAAIYSNGGAIYGYYGNAAFTDVSFEENYAYSGGGAVFLSYTYGNSTFDGCTFAENTARYQGGAIYSYSYNNVDIEESTFDYNETETSYGGAIYNYYSNLSVTRSAFTANRSLTNMGGAIYSYYYYSDEPDLKIVDSTFTSNEALYHGGAVASLYNRFQITGSTFHVNDTDRNGMGGALFTQDTLAGQVHGNTFTGNNAGYGGASYSDNAGTSPDRWMNNTFVENTANIGGAMVFSGSAVTEITNNTFVSNTSVEAGGNLVLVNSEVDFTNNAVTHSTAGAGVEIYDQTSKDGSRFSYNAWYEIADGLAGGKSTEAALMTNGLDDTDPAYAAYSPDGNADNDSFVLLRDSGLIDAGDPKRLDPDGSTSDIGAWGGPGVVVEDRDGDGYDSWLDCDDDDATVHPGASDEFYDGINSDCLSGSDFDADGDGEDAEAHGGADCDDADADVTSDCGDADTRGDTGAVEEKPPKHADKEASEGCSAVGAGAGMLWLVGLVGAVRRSPHFHPAPQRTLHDTGE